MTQPDPPFPDPLSPDPQPPAAAPGQHRPATLHTVFFGRDGLRAGWGLLLFAIVYFALQAALFRLVFAAGIHLQPPGPHDVITPHFALWNESPSAGAILLTTFIMMLIERRRFSAYGLALNRPTLNLLQGAAWGLAFISLLVALLDLSGLLVFDGRNLPAASALRFGLIWLAVFILVGLYEELFFRGYVQLTLARGLAAIYELLGLAPARAAGFWTAAVILSFGFGLVHTSNPGESPVGVFAAGLVGLVFCLSLWRTGALWWAIGFHIAWDWAESYLYGVYDSGLLSRGRLLLTHPQGKLLFSGGLTGPEGSLLILPVLGCAAAAIVLTLKPTPASPSATPTPHLTTDEPGTDHRLQ